MHELRNAQAATATALLRRDAAEQVAATAVRNEALLTAAIREATRPLPLFGAGREARRRLTRLTRILEETR